MKKGFTLAEVLITLGVIGIVASLTLPNVLNNFNNKTQVAQLQRTYNMLANAVTQLMADEQVDSLVQSSLSSTEGRDAFMFKYLKVQKDCGNSPSNCFSNSYQTWNRSETVTMDLNSDKFKSPLGGQSTDFKCVVVDTGASICLSTIGNSYSRVVVDTNGAASPNLCGRDLFKFNVFSDGRLGTFNKGAAGAFAMYAAGHNEYTYCQGFVDGCFDQIVSSGWKMNY